MNANPLKQQLSILLTITGLLFSATVISGDKIDQNSSLYDRLGGYNAISAVVDDVVTQIASDEKLGRFWAHRGNDGIAREKQLIVDFVVENAGGPLYYRGREMKLSHKGMKIDNQDWNVLITALQNTLNKFKVPNREQREVLEFFESTKTDIVEVQSKS